MNAMPFWMMFRRMQNREQNEFMKTFPKEIFFSNDNTLNILARLHNLLIVIKQA